MLNQIGTKIRQYREESGISQKKLGIALGLSDKAISAYESNRTLPPLDTLYRIAQELKKPITSFLSDEGEVRINDRISNIERNITDILEELQKIKGDITDIN